MRARGPRPAAVLGHDRFILGADSAELHERARRLILLQGGDEQAAGDLVRSPEEGWIVGTPEQAVEQLQALAEAGVERVMLQHLLHTDHEALELIAQEIAPQLR